MELRIKSQQANPEAYKAMLDLEQFIVKSGLDKKTYEFIKLRASQINGCSYCIDMHSKDLLAMGESVDRLLLLSAWRETPIYSDAERAVLELTEYATKLSEAGVPDDVYARVRAHFDEKQYVDLLMAISVINAWNRIGVGTGMFPGCF
ncbi:carboxymuconolactone decarboxylase family protein [Cohnella suwonensis]|uniref:Carboxymuconolactone decarboxylase family protein n=1 Tax=Cohnella suwonensis TaxID=696072 RepID=A0ABW0LSQ6_9BACL